MNCKQGDLAIIVRAPLDPNFIGKIVTCVKIDNQFPDSWQTEPTLFGMDGALVVICDRGMRPIRDNPGQDETLTWAPVPKKESVC